MTFSIIIPVYNVAPYLRECLDSVLAAARTLSEKCEVSSEKCGGVEIICVDDGSTDGSGAILDEYREKLGGLEAWKLGSKPLNLQTSKPLSTSIKVIHQANAGVSAARNAALDVATGEWISFLDADDAIKDDYFERFISCPLKCDVNFFNMQFVYSDGILVDRIMPSVICVGLENDTSDALNVIVNGGDGYDALGWTWNKIIKRDLIFDNNVRFADGISYFEDELFALDLFKYVKSFQILPATVYRYRRLPNGLTCTGMNGNGKKLIPLIRQFIIRAKSARLNILEQLAVKRIRDWFRVLLKDSAVSSRELAQVFWEIYTSFPALYSSNSCIGGILKRVRWLPDCMRKSVVVVLIAMNRMMNR